MYWNESDNAREITKRLPFSVIYSMHYSYLSVVVLACMVFEYVDTHTLNDCELNLFTCIYYIVVAVCILINYIFFASMLIRKYI